MRALLRVDPPGRAVLCEENGAPIRESEWRDLSWNAPLARVPRRARFPGGVVFETTEVEAVAAWEARFSRPGAWSWIVRLERLGPHTLLFALLALAVVFSGARWGVPALASYLAERIPDEARRQIDVESVRGLDLLALEPSDLEGSEFARLQLMFDAAVADAGGEGSGHRLLTRGGGALGANALALPGGSVVVTDELVRLADSDDALYGVLAHELAHVERRHGLRAMLEASFVALALVVAAGDASQVAQFALTLPTLLVTRGYSRGHEAEADADALAQLLASGRDPACLAVLFEKMSPAARPEAENADSSALWTWLSTHPSSAERSRQLRAASPKSRCRDAGDR